MKRWTVIVLSALLAACATTKMESSGQGHVGTVRDFHQQRKGEYPGDQVNRATDELMAGGLAGLDPVRVRRLARIPTAMALRYQSRTSPAFSRTR